VARSALTALDRYRLTLTAGVALLLLAGVTRGEVGRLWLPLMPLLLAGSGTDDREAAEAIPARQAAGLGALAGLQTLAIASWWIV
jgi:hypothetical protein